MSLKACLQECLPITKEVCLTPTLSGTHQDGMLKNRQTYEIMTPESVGVKQTSLVMGKHSGRHAFKDKMNSLGYPDLTDDVVSNAFAKFKVLADKKKHVYDEDIIALVDDSLIIDNKVNAISLKSLKVFAGTGEPQRAEMKIGRASCRERV